ncbi:hypothetical protein DM860_013111 [Cuscuta australis]|uniref:FAR1 domain-containing protein n=1 Tax=Cuscuta australis TaxID=267555 RepID=A0A328D702_9ASTE|nr:hypothetical protein DM860_013111 [Cuscuta australis]
MLSSLYIVDLRKKKTLVAERRKIHNRLSALGGAVRTVSLIGTNFGSNRDTLFGPTFSELKSVCTGMFRGVTKEVFGDIFQNVKVVELLASKAQDKHEENPSEDHRAQANLAAAKLIQACKLVEHLAMPGCFYLMQMESYSIDSSFLQTPSFASITLGNWVPDVPEGLKIKIGQVFSSFVECQAFYNQYAQESGFSIRCGSSSKSRNGDKTWKTYVCSKEGFRKQPKTGVEVITHPQEQDPLSEQYPLSEESITSKQPKRKKRAETREGCRTRILVVSCEEGCKIIQFEESHVHPMHSIDTQCENEYKIQNASLTSNPVLRAELPLELHAREVYTHTNFYLFQEEFWNGLCYCGIQGMESVEGQTMIVVRDNRVAKGKLYNVRKDLETYFGCKVPDRVEIHPPTIGVTKGRKRRIKSGVEKGQEKQKHTRPCRSCNKMTTHDSRNCPLKNNSFCTIMLLIIWIINVVALVMWEVDLSDYHLLTWKQNSNREV